MMFIQRISLFLAIFAGVIFIHPILAFIFACMYGLTRSYSYYEIVVLGIIIDVMYGKMNLFSHWFIPVYTILGIFLYFVLQYTQQRTSIHV